MTSTVIGLPDRYRPLDEVGPEEHTPTGVIRCWRAKDRVLNRDVAIRMHTPAGPAAHGWITRALTAGGLANPALAMVYDASEGSEDSQAPGAAAYVVNEWIEGETLAERLGRGPMPDRDVRPMMRRLADGVAEAHRVGLAVGGLTTENVVLRPNGLVGLRAVPAATGTIEGDISALGDLLEACLTGLRPEDAGVRTPGAADLVALARRARSTESGQAISSVAAMAALLAARPRSSSATYGSEGDGSRRRRGRREPMTSGRRPTDEPNLVAAPPATAAPVDAFPASDDGPRDLDAEQAVPLDPSSRPPVPPTRAVPPSARREGLPTAPDRPATGRRGDTVTVGVPPDAASAPADDAPFGAFAAGSTSYGNTAEDRGLADVLGADPYADSGYLDDEDLDDETYADDPDTAAGGRRSFGARRTLLVVGLPVLALAVVVALAWWLGSGVLSVAGSVDDLEGSTPSVSAPAGTSAAEAEPTADAPVAAVAVSAGSVFDPGGDGQPENDDEVPLSFDSDPATTWSTLTYQGSPAFGNLKDGVGVIYDLGSEQELAGVTLTSTLPGSTVEVRAASGTDGALEDFPVLAGSTLEQETELTFEEPATTRYLLVWFTGLVESDGGFSADLAEVSPLAVG